MNVRHFSLMFALLLGFLPLTPAVAQRFDDFFEDRTLRLDYIFGGSNKSQHIFFEQAYAKAGWAGRKSRLTDVPLRGNGQITLKSHQTGQQLYVHTFSTLFQEWQATEEATKVHKVKSCMDDRAS